MYPMLKKEPSRKARIGHQARVRCYFFASAASEWITSRTFFLSACNSLIAERAPVTGADLHTEGSFKACGDLVLGLGLF